MKEIKTLAIFKTEWGSKMVTESTYNTTGSVRLTDGVEVEFTYRPVEDTIKEEVEMINARIEELKSNVVEEIAVLTAKRQELLALSAPGQFRPQPK